MKKHLCRRFALIMSILMLSFTAFIHVPELNAAAEDAEDEVLSAVPDGFLPFVFGGSDADELAVTEPEGSIDLGTFDFVSMTAGFLCLEAALSGAESAEISFFLDREDDCFAQIILENAETALTSAVLLEGQGITGVHDVRMTYCLKGSRDGAELLLKQLFFAENSLPVLEICIDETRGSIREMNEDPEHGTKCFGSMNLHIPQGYQEEYTGTVYKEALTEVYELDYIRGRGNSTWGRSKKPYRIKLEDKADILGMGKDKNWVLLANYYDMTMLRNKITYDIASRLMPEGTFVPQSAFVHVIMNGRYLGTYALSEQIRIGKERLNIDDLEELTAEEAEDEELITGGYLLNIESMNPEGKIIKTPRYSFPVDSPEPDYFTEKEQEYITEYLTELEKRIFELPEGGAAAACEEMLDLDSYIDYYLIQELCLNGDGFKTDSDHFYKVRNGKLYFGPLWDFDYVSWGGDKLNTEGFLMADWAPWFIPLLHDDTFRARLMERWEALKELMEAYMEEGGPFDRYADSIAMARYANYAASSSFLWDEEMPGFTEELGPEITFDSELLRLKTWISDRIAWMDAHISEIRPVNVHVEFRDEDELIYHLMLDRNDLLTDDYLPQPMKKGYRLTGWVRTDAEGNETALAEEDPQDENADLLIYRAVWEPYDAEAALKELKFTEEVYELPSYSYVWLTELLSSDPADFDMRYVEFSMECDPEDCAYLSENAVSLMQKGEVRVTASCGSRKTSCRIMIVEEDGD